MTDRFKFRVWNKKTKTIHDVEGVYPYQDEYTQGGEVFLKGFKTSYYFPEQVVLMQCTGLKDKNGKLIYEGDIIVNEKFVKYITKWNDNIGQFYISKINPSKYDNWKDWHLARHDLDYEVIGNIYENPELLGVENE